MQSVTFRVDGSRHLGTGHVVRCLVLAQAFQGRNIRPVFVTKDHEPGILALIEGYGFHVNALPSTLTMEEDASATQRLVADNRSTFLVTDMANPEYTTDPERYVRYAMAMLKGIRAYTISLDDLFIAELPFDLRIIPYCGVEQKPPDSQGKTKWLLGPAYFIAQESFREAAAAARFVARAARRILVTMGGSDPCGLTAAVLKNLGRLKPKNGLEVRVVVGPGFTDMAVQEILQCAASARNICRILSAAPGDLAQLMIWSDLAITAGGLTKYEAAMTGTPNIVIAAFTREAEMCRFFSEAGAAYCLDRGALAQEGCLAAVVQSLMEAYETRLRMSRCGRELVDGFGVERILAAIPSSLFSSIGG